MGTDRHDGQPHLLGLRKRANVQSVAQFAILLLKDTCARASGVRQFFNLDAKLVED